MNTDKAPIRLIYPIQPEYVNNLGGIVLEQPLNPGNSIKILGNKHTVYHCLPITCNLYVATNIITVTHGNYSLMGTALIKRFANFIGVHNQNALIFCLMNNCTIEASKAVKQYYFLSFREENIFQTWTAR